jgi:hypothetical protein
MRKIVFLLLAIAATISLTSCNLNYGKTRNAQIFGGASAKFSAAEIKAAENCILKIFIDFEGCDLQKLWYDESVSNAEYGVDNVNGIVILSNFHVDVSGSDGSLKPNSDYTDYKWFIVRDNKDAKWMIKDWGYA